MTRRDWFGRCLSVVSAGLAARVMGAAATAPLTVAVSPFLTDKDEWFIVQPTNCVWRDRLWATQQYVPRVYFTKILDEN